MKNFCDCNDEYFTCIKHKYDSHMSSNKFYEYQISEGI
jgi:hypothetical protein